MRLKRVILMAITLAAFFNSSRVLAFNDVNAHWARKDIAIISAKGIFGGFPDGSFKPQEPVTRAQFAKIITYFEHAAADAGILQSADSPYSDLSDKHWAKGVIYWSNENGLMNGYNNLAFMPDKSLTRAEAAVVFARLLKLKSNQGELNYKDADKVPVWAQDGIAAATQNGILGGYKDETFKPLQTITRGELAALLTRAADLKGEKYEGYATLKFIDGVNKKVQLESYGQKLTVYYEQDLAVYQKHPTKLGQIALPAKVFYILSSAGKLKYLEINPNKEPVKFGFALLNNHASPASGQSAGLVSESTLAVSNEDQAQQARKNILSAIGADKLDSAYDGRGVTVAVLDSGVDVGHPELRNTTDGKNKIAGWKDFTDEGQVDTKTVVQSNSGNINAGDFSLKANSLISKSGNIHIGFLKELDQGIDFNKNGQHDVYTVAVLDSKIKGVYDTVYLDTNNDQDFDDEMPLKLYSEDKSYLSLKTANGRQYNFVAAVIETNGNKIHFGFDSAGHGTSVAATLAGNGPVKGIAPGAQLVVLKVVDKEGKVDYDLVLEAIKYASENNIPVVNMSFGFDAPYSTGQNQLGRLITKYAREKNIVFVAAAGNKGPGISSLNSPAVTDGVIGVSGIITPEIYKLVTGGNLEGIKLMSGTSIGPRADGKLSPLVAAPALTVTALAGGGYSVREGTSFAAPIVAGATAIMLQSAHQQNKKYSFEDIAEAFYSSAKDLEFGPYATGGGLVNISEGLKQLKYGVVKPQLTLTSESKLFGRTSGLFIRNATPARIGVYVKNPLSHGVKISWKPNNVLRPQAVNMFLPANTERTAWFDVYDTQTPGVFSTVLTAYDNAETEIFGRFPLTLINPVTKGSYLEEGTIQPGEVNRYFFDVANGASSLVLKLNPVFETVMGRLRFYLFRPDGQLEKASGPMGYQTNQDSYTHVIDKPRAGRWEAVVEADANNVLFGFDLLSYTFSMWSGTQVDNFSSSIDNPSYYVEVYPKKVSNGTNLLTLTLRDRATMSLVKGDIEINGLLYTLNDGKVNLKCESELENINLRLMLP